MTTSARAVHTRQGARAGQFHNRRSTSALAMVIARSSSGTRRCGSPMMRKLKWKRPTTFTPRNRRAPDRKAAYALPGLPDAPRSDNAANRTIATANNAKDHALPRDDTYCRFLMVIRRYEGVSQNAESP